MESPIRAPRLREPSVRTGLQLLARVGYSAEGFVYLAVGAVAALAAIGALRAPEEPRSALSTVSSATVGGELLWMVGAGLLALAVWDLLVGLLDIESRGWRGRALVERIASLFGAIFHGSLGWWAIARARGRARLAGDGATERMTATVMEQPMGRWLLLAFAVSVLLFAAAEVVEAWSPGIGHRLGAALTRRARRTIAAIGRVGVTARAGLLAVTGWFLLRAALLERPAEARGVGESLGALELPAIGPLVLGAVALGLALYGVWQLLNAVFARVDVG